MDGLTIHTILAVLACLFTGITFFRMYLRTGLKGHLLVSLGAVTALFGGIGVYVNERTGNERIGDLFSQLFAIPGIVLVVIGLILIYTIESGAAQNAYGGHSIIDIVFGNVSSLEKKKYKPALTRGGGIIIGSLLIIYGLVMCWYGYPSKSYSGILGIAVGVTIFVISILALKDKGGKK